MSTKNSEKCNASGDWFLLRAGFSRKILTPKAPCFLSGYPHTPRTSTGTHDDLFVSTLFVKSGNESALLLSLDWLFVTANFVTQCREEISKATGVAESKVLIAATHTHSGPHTAEVLAWREDSVLPKVDREYLRTSIDLCVESAMDAISSAKEAHGRWVSAQVGGLAGGNRIDPNGPEDPEAGLLVLRSATEGIPFAILGIYGMHPTVLHEDSTLFSADFIAFVRRDIEQAFPGAGVVYMNGVCGNQSPRRAVRAQTFAEAERIGCALAARLIEAISSLKPPASSPQQGAVRTRQSHLSTSGKTFPEVSVAEENLQRIRARFEQLKAENAEKSVVRTAECTVFGAEAVVNLARAELDGSAQSLREKYQFSELQLLKIGDRFIAAWPGEFFVEFGLAAKAGAPSAVHVVTMANGELQGYVVTAEAEALGGYESQLSLLPSQVGEQFVKATIQGVAEMQ